MKISRRKKFACFSKNECFWRTSCSNVAKAYIRESVPALQIRRKAAHSIGWGISLYIYLFLLLVLSVAKNEMKITVSGFEEGKKEEVVR